RLEKQMKGTKERTRLSLHPAPDVNVYGEPHHLNFSEYMHSLGFLSFTRTRALLDPYMRLKFFTSAKFNEKKYAEDKEKVISYYNTQGYRDASLLADTLYNAPDGGLDVALKVTEGKKYYFGDITWKGNT